MTPSIRRVKNTVISGRAAAAWDEFPRWREALRIEEERIGYSRYRTDDPNHPNTRCPNAIRHYAAEVILQHRYIVQNTPLAPEELRLHTDAIAAWGLILRSEDDFWGLKELVLLACARSARIVKGVDDLVEDVRMVFRKWVREGTV
jgi:hypothetical protein